ncbi:MAG: hypothetical protein IJZ15_01945 [Oscillospiraceae bacterium]|nr:hypothetical protein [Oscillospiraceae bacterium]
MEIARYLAMTADEFATAPPIPERKAWMACHFSPYSTTLSNLPEAMPANSLLILDDSTPPSGQDLKAVAAILETILKKHKCSGLLLDFQRPDCPMTQEMAQALITLPFPVCVSEFYAKSLDCPIFLPPLPLTIPLTDYITPWKDRKIWLDTALSCEKITVTEKGSTFTPLTTIPDHSLADKELHCHYRIQQTNDSFVFTLHRTKQDLSDLLAEAEAFGVEAAVGLYQELK